MFCAGHWGLRGLFCTGCWGFAFLLVTGCFLGVDGFSLYCFFSHS